MRFWYCLLLFFFFALPADGKEAYFLSEPCPSPGGKTVVFVSEGDLWKVDSKGGTATRLTGMEGAERAPRISPDGKWLAFSGYRDGNYNLYVMPLKGGKIRQLTFHSGFDLMDNWSWDSKSLYFTSNRFNRYSLYRVSLSGGTPRRLIGHFFNTPHRMAIHPVNDRYYFTDSWESFYDWSRKGYRGPFNPDIKSFDPKRKKVYHHTTFEGKDLWVTIDQKGRIYFASDRGGRHYNLFRLEGKKKTPLTHFSTSIGRPQVSAGGEVVVFEKDYQIYAYWTEKKKTAQIPIRLYRENPLPLKQKFNTTGKITDFDVSPDGKKLAFVSRGELFVSDHRGKFIRQVPTGQSGRISEVHWLADSRRLLYNQTVKGWLNWFIIEASGKGKEKAITSDNQSNRKLTFNKDRSRALYLSGRREVRHLDLKTLKSKTLLKEELWGFYNDFPRFSPDERYVIFTARRNFEYDLFLYSFEKKTTVNLTKTGVSEDNPFWSANGRYLYFTSDRYQPIFPRGRVSKKVYRLPLLKWDRPFRTRGFEKLFEKGKKSPKKKKDNQKNKKGKKKSKKKKKGLPGPKVVIDFRDILERFQRVSPSAGKQRGVYVITRGKKDIVLYASNHDGSGYHLWKTEIEPFERTKTVKIRGAKVRWPRIKKGKKHHYLLMGGRIYRINLRSNRLHRIRLSHRFTRSMATEFKQIFFEVWAGIEENYYDENFHGIDWKEVKKHYRQFLPHLHSRANLRRLLNDMLGEVNSSHMGFYSRGSEEGVHYHQQTVNVGILFDNERPYVVKKVVADSPADRAKKDIRPGDVLLAVDGKKVDSQANREAYFTRPTWNGELKLTFRRKDKTFSRLFHVQSPRALRNQLYDEWIDANQRQVDLEGKKKIAYVYMKNMVTSTLKKFLREMTSEGHRRKAIILDLRYNKGGNVHDEVLKFLSQKPYAKWKYRGGKTSTQPNFAPAGKPIVLLVNERSLSDGEMMAAGFKALKLGKIVGTETYRWVIFTTGRRLVDGSSFRIPAWGVYSLKGENLEKKGVSPHISVKNTMKDRLEGRDPQLKKALEILLKKLEEEKSQGDKVSKGVPPQPEFHKTEDQAVKRFLAFQHRKKKRDLDQLLKSLDKIYLLGVYSARKEGKPWIFYGLDRHRPQMNSLPVFTSRKKVEAYRKSLSQPRAWSIVDLNPKSAVATLKNSARYYRVVNHRRYYVRAVVIDPGEKGKSHQVSLARLKKSPSKYVELLKKLSGQKVYFLYRKVRRSPYPLPYMKMGPHFHTRTVLSVPLFTRRAYGEYFKKKLGKMGDKLEVIGLSPRELARELRTIRKTYVTKKKKKYPLRGLVFNPQIDKMEFRLPLSVYLGLYGDGKEGKKKESKKSKKEKAKK